jgi:hypothetical protein
MPTSVTSASGAASRPAWRAASMLSADPSMPRSMRKHQSRFGLSCQSSCVRSAARTTTTGQGARCSTPSVVDPSTSDMMGSPSLWPDHDHARGPRASHAAYLVDRAALAASVSASTWAAAARAAASVSVFSAHSFSRSMNSGSRNSGRGTPKLPRSGAQTLTRRTASAARAAREPSVAIRMTLVLNP